MFGGKHEKELMEEAARLKEELEKKNHALEQISRQKEGLEEQFAAFAAANAQMGKDLELAKEHLKQAAKLSASGHASAEELKQGICYMKEQAGKAEEAQDSFYNEIKKQNEKVMEVVENNKHFTTPMKTIMELPGEYREERERLGEQLNRMSGFSKNMGVLALNAAIEAGKMGEAGKKFVASAEDIRALSEEYEAAVSVLAEQMEEIDAKVSKAEEQSRYLNQLLKDNNVSMGKILKESSRCILEYENHRCSAGRFASKGVSDGLGDFFEKEASIAELEEWVEQELSDMAEAFAEQKNCAGGIEQAFGLIYHLIMEVREK